MNKELNKTKKERSWGKLSRVKVLNLITLAVSCLSLAFAIAFIVIYTDAHTQVFKFVSYDRLNGGARTRYLYGYYIYDVVTMEVVFAAILTILAAVNFAVNFMYSPKQMASVAQEDLKLQKIIKIVNMVGGLIFVNGILVLIMLWKQKKNILTFLAPIAASAIVLAVVPSVVQVSTYDKLNKPVESMKSLMNRKSVINIDRKNRNVEIDLKALSEEMTDEKLAYELSARDKVDFGETFSSDEYLETWLSSFKIMDQDFAWKETEEVKIWLNWDKNVEKIEITNSMNKAINAIVKNLRMWNTGYVVSFGNNWNLKEVSGDLGIAFKARSVAMPKDVKENPFKK
ncbi:hypothetical protein [Mycoplasma todarodis]|uniref:hypothetical protein n=1 Tax=Mycoplasma todarodis TaxID=1937191 RepID=UPI003B2F1343